MTLNPSSTPIAQHDCVLPTCGLRVRFFYPCVSNDAESYPGASWMPVSATRWSDENTLAYAEYLGLPFARLLSYVGSFLTSVRLPWNADVPLARQPAKFPVALFSHGLGSNLGGYVSVCADMARRTQRIVVAVEHGDGSAHAAYVGPERKRIPFEHSSSLTARDNRAKQQLRQRLDEFKAVVSDLRLLNDGKAKQLALPPDETVVEFSGRFDFTVPFVVAGHSFGSSTAFGYALQHTNTVNQVSHVICLDPWLSPIPSDILGGGFVGRNTQVLHVDQEQTGRTESVFLRERFASPFKRVCVVGGLHNNATDFATKLPTIIAVVGQLAAKRINPEHLMNAQNEAVVHFINGHWGAFEPEIRDGKIDHLKL